MKLALVTLAGVLMSVASVAPASALEAPELFVRPQTWDTHEAAGDWIPLASAPVLNYLGGYQIGYRLQASGQPSKFQRVALAVVGVPDGAPTQPSASPPFCVGRAGTAGTIVDAGPELQFEGDGGCTVTVSVGPGLDCQTAGASTTAAFSVDVHVAPALVGEPLSFRVTPLPGDPLVGVTAAAPAGGDPGAVFATPWSAPLSVDVRSDFRRRTGTVSGPRAKRPRFTFVAEWPEYAAGGSGTVTVSRVTGCKGSRYKLRKVASARGRFDAKRMRLTFTRPRAGFYLGRFTFSGTRFLRAGDDPNPVLLMATRNRLGFSDPKAFAHCPGYRP